MERNVTSKSKKKIHSFILPSSVESSDDGLKQWSWYKISCRHRDPRDILSRSYRLIDPVLRKDYDTKGGKHQKQPVSRYKTVLGCFGCFFGQISELLSARFKLPPLASPPSKLWSRFGHRQATIKSFNCEGQSAVRKFSAKKSKKWKKSYLGKKIKSINKISPKTLMACNTRKTADENFQAAEICDARWEEADLYASLVTRTKTRTGTLHGQRMCSSCSWRLQKWGGFTKASRCFHRENRRAWGCWTSKIQPWSDDYRRWNGRKKSLAKETKTTWLEA